MTAQVPIESIIKINYKQKIKFSKNILSCMKYCDDHTCLCNITLYTDLLYYSIPGDYIKETYNITDFELLKENQLLYIGNKDKFLVGIDDGVMFKLLLKSAYFKDIVKLAYISEYIDIDACIVLSKEDYRRVYKKFIELVYAINTQLLCSKINKIYIKYNGIHIIDRKPMLYTCKQNPNKIIAFYPPAVYKIVQIRNINSLFTHPEFKSAVRKSSALVCNNCPPILYNI